MNLNALILFLCSLSNSHLSYAQPLRRVLLDDTFGDALKADPSASSPSSRRSLSSTTVAAVCGYECPDKDYRATTDALLPVRCCRDTEPDSWTWTKNKRCAVWAQSRLSGLQCFTVNFHRAQQICAENGGRLCTKEEMEDKCTSRTGCGFDDKQIWTSDVQSGLEAF